MISFITTSGNFLKVLIKKVRSPCAESTDILVSLFAALVISFKKTHKPTKTHHTTLHSHLSFFRVLMCMTCLFFLYMVCTRILIEKKYFGSPSSPVLYCRNCLHQQNAAICRSVRCCILLREYCVLMTDYLSSYRNTFIFTE